MRLNKFKINIFVMPYAYNNSVIMLLYNSLEARQSILLKGDIVDYVFKGNNLNLAGNDTRSIIKRYSPLAEYILRGSVRIPKETQPLFNSYMADAQEELNYLYLRDTDKVTLQTSLIFEYLKLHGKYYGKKERVFGQKNTQSDLKEGTNLG